MAVVWVRGCVNQPYWGKHFTVYVCIKSFHCTLKNLHNVKCKLYFNKVGKDGLVNNITRNVYYLEEKLKSLLIPDANIDPKQMVKHRINWIYRRIKNYVNPYLISGYEALSRNSTNETTMKK